MNVIVQVKILIYYYLIYWQWKYNKQNAKDASKKMLQEILIAWVYETQYYGYLKSLAQTSVGIVSYS